MSAPMEVGKSDTGMISWPHMPTRSLGATESDSEAALDVWPPKTESRARIFFWKALFKIRAQPLTAHDASLCHKY